MESNRFTSEPSVIVCGYSATQIRLVTSPARGIFRSSVARPSPTQPVRQHVFLSPSPRFHTTWNAWHVNLSHDLSQHLVLVKEPILFTWYDTSHKAKQSFLQILSQMTCLILCSRPWYTFSPFKVTQICSLGWLVRILIIKRTHQTEFSQGWQILWKHGD